MDFDSIYALAIVVIPIVTNYIKQWLPQRLWALVPFILGAAFAGIYGKEAGVQIQELLVQAFMVGGGATLLYNVDKKVIAPTVDAKKSANNGR
jgi:hypothetical protein